MYFPNRKPVKENINFSKQIINIVENFDDYFEDVNNDEHIVIFRWISILCDKVNEYDYNDPIDVSIKGQYLKISFDSKYFLSPNYTYLTWTPKGIRKRLDITFKKKV